MAKRSAAMPSSVGIFDETPRCMTSPESDLSGYEVLVCVCGGIAAYKVCEVVSKLVQRGCGVTVAVTRSARKFVGPTTLQALTGRRVLTSLWSAADPDDVQHIALTGAADLVLIAPATANIIGKVACGIADDVVTTLVISAASPVVLAPAMNDRMWANPIVQQNVAALKQHAYTLVGPGEGRLACRSIGPGRMAEPGEILETVVAKLKSQPPKKT
ncbi:MAG: flavoprotein [Planctomycetota bacterium]